MRAALGVRTVFNILGPLTNPAEPPFHVIGAFDLPTAELMAQALAGMPIERAFVVHGAAGWDEPTPVGPFEAVRRARRRGARANSATRPTTASRPATVDDLAGGDAAHNARRCERVLSGAAARARPAMRCCSARRSRSR